MTDTPVILVLSSDDESRGVLLAAGFEVTDQESAAAEVVLLDIDALEHPTLRIAELRAKHPDTPVIVLSRRAEPRSVVEAVHAGAQDWIRIPSRETELEKAVDEALLRRRLSLEQRGVVRLLESQGRQVEDERRQLNDRMVAMAAELQSAHHQLEDAHRQLRGRVAQLVMLYRIGRDLTTHRNWDDALSSFLGSLCEFLDAPGAALLLRSQQGRRLASRSVVGMSEQRVAECIESLRAPRPIEGREPLLSSLAEASRPQPRSCAELDEPWDLTVIPLWHRDQDLGVLLLDKAYASTEAMQDDFYFLITIQTVLTEEVASAQAFSELRKLQRFQERTLDHLGSGIVTVESDGMIHTANAKARELLGATSATGLPIGQVIQLGSEGPSIRHWLAEVDGVVPSSIEGQLIPVDGTEPIEVSLVVSSLPGELPGESHHVCVIEDLTHRRALEAERRRAARQKELLIMAAEWAHDVRTPLTGILHGAELLAGALDPRSQKLRHFTVIQNEVERINGLVNHFLDYAKPVRIKATLSDLVVLANEVVDLLGPPASARGVLVEYQGEDGMQSCPCRVDSDQVKQVLLNLVSNAIDAAADRGEVRVRLRTSTDAVLDEDGRTGPGAIIQVEDNGPGVPAEIVDRLFVPFFTTKPEGTGLGLAISDKIVRAHDGDLRYRREGDLTILRIVLPLDESGHRPDPVGAENDRATMKLQARG